MVRIRPYPPLVRRSLAPFFGAFLCFVIHSCSTTCSKLYDAPSSSSSSSSDNARRGSPPLTILPIMAHAFVHTTTTTAVTSKASSSSSFGTTTIATTRLFSLKPAAIPLMDSGKALARSGELLIDLTSTLGLYGGSLSAVGAGVRNCGDCLAQAAASCRFKTAAELVVDELREGADCLREGSSKLSRAVEESEVDGDAKLMERITDMIDPTKQAALWLEEAGASIMKRESVDVVGRHLISCGEALEVLSAKVGALDSEKEEGKLSSKRMMYASQQMIMAGRELTGEKKEMPKGKGWLKG